MPTKGRIVLGYTFKRFLNDVEKLEETLSAIEGLRVSDVIHRSYDMPTELLVFSNEKYQGGKTYAEMRGISDPGLVWKMVGHGTDSAVFNYDTNELFFYITYHRALAPNEKACGSWEQQNNLALRTSMIRVDLSKVLDTARPIDGGFFEQDTTPGTLNQMYFSEWNHEETFLPYLGGYDTRRSFTHTRWILSNFLENLRTLPEHGTTWKFDNVNYELHHLVGGGRDNLKYFALVVNGQTVLEGSYFL